jgi:acyl-CoA thioesterase FadM
VPRIKLKPLERYSFETEIAVRTTDINFAGHLANDRLLSLVQEARVAFLAQHDFTELDCGGVALTIADAVIAYRGEAFAGDLLKFEVTAGQPTSHGFRLFYRVTRPADVAEIALVENGLVCFDYKERKIRPVPAALRVLFADSS